MNLPEELHSHGLRELSAIESARGSFEEATEAIRRITGVGCAKRQVELLAARSVVDFEAFYENIPRMQGNQGEVLVLSVDGKGIVMRPDALRPATAKAAGKATAKLKTRLSRGEKHNRKRMAEVGAVYDVTPVIRTPSDIIGRETDTERAPAPKAANKWLTASVVDNTASVISAVFDEAHRRDPEHRRTWIALVDGAKHQIDCINAEAKTRGVKVSIVCDFIHVLEYIWSSSPKVTLPQKRGSLRRHSQYYEGRHQRSRPRSGARPLVSVSIPVLGRTLTVALTTYLPSGITSTTAKRSKKAGRSPLE
ncbi:hypothetical protein FEAC_05130 [Ferrimicrobium acidiphilum DSM 19497]|uniref:ISKra4 family transposase n=1 Tax=Ferrimicrobium acidiphilum DSM 19497 TaxID=1121877 RepID=A0A0D8FXT7_9ACTN|nr:hypothetical protein FEAC_05130 [Ferrimicrobium acidiphilum DSM 19497]